MPKFKCKNPECLFFEQEKLEGKATYVMIGDKLKTREAFCPSCNQERKEVIEKREYVPPAYESVGMNSNRRNWSDSRGGGIRWY